MNISQLLNDITSFSANEIDQLIHKYIEDNQLNMGNIMNTLRLVLVGKGKGPNLSEIIYLIGKEETIERINRAIEDINA